MINPSIFVMTYACHSKMNEIFFLDNHHLTSRLLLDTYHLVLFEINGTMVTDFYVQTCLDKYFVAARFDDYERVSSSKFTNVHKNKKKKIDTKEREFLGKKQEVPIPTSKDEMKFYQEVKAALSKKNIA